MSPFRGMDTRDYPLGVRCYPLGVAARHLAANVWIPDDSGMTGECGGNL